MTETAWAVTATAPTRICDLGGWTDTWFAGHGAVCNLAVRPLARVAARARPAGTESGRVTFSTPDLAGPHPLLEAAVAEVGPPPGWCIDISVACDAPPGSATGTSASVTVAVVGAVAALARLADPARSELTRLAAAEAAHRAEYVRLGRQCGVQDQLAAAHGGISWIEIGPFPEARVRPVPIAAPRWGELDRRLAVVFLGQPHDSSAVHEAVIAELSDAGPDDERLERLRRCAAAGRDALLGGDLAAFGRAMIANTDAQADLHPDLVAARARRAIEAARGAGAIGWKVNGAGGDGGSLTFLTDGRRNARNRVTEAALEADAALVPLPVALSRHGLRVRSSALANP